MVNYRYLQGDDKPITGWWESLAGHRGERAVLRRAGRPEEVMLTTPFFHFLSFPGISSSWSKEQNLMGSAMVAAILSRVKENHSQLSFAESLAKPLEKGGKSPVSELRFSALQKSRTVDEFFTRLSRAVSLLRGKVNILSLANDIVHWERELRSGRALKPMNRLTVKWANDYFLHLPKS